LPNLNILCSSNITANFCRFFFLSSYLAPELLVATLLNSPQVNFGTEAWRFTLRQNGTVPYFFPIYCSPIILPSTLHNLKSDDFLYIVIYNSIYTKVFNFLAPELFF